MKCDKCIHYLEGVLVCFYVGREREERRERERERREEKKRKERERERCKNTPLEKKWLWT